MTREGAAGPNEASERLAAAVVARRSELGMSMSDVQREGGPSAVTLQAIETGQWKHEPTGSTLRKLDTALRWPDGMARQVVVGRDPFEAATHELSLEDGQHPVLGVKETAAELGISPVSVRTTMNRAGYYEVRGYLRTDVDAVKGSRRRRSATPLNNEEAK